jgi:hypothetical protein
MHPKTSRIWALPLLLAILQAAACSDVGDSTAVPGEDAAQGDGTSGSSGTSTGGDDSASSGASSGSGSGDDATTDSGTAASPDADATVGEEAGETPDGETQEAATEASTPDSGGDAGSDATIEAGAPDTGTPDAGSDATVDSGTPDATADSGGTNEAGPGDAGNEASSGGPSPCTSAPCAAQGPNSVICDGNNQHGNVCTATEALLVAQDIKAGRLTAAGQLEPGDPSNPTATNSCYECMFNAGGLNDDQFASDIGNECGDVLPNAPLINAGNPVQVCLDTLTCLISHNLADSNPPTAAYCGTATANACQTTVGAANGVCLSVETNGLGTTTPGSVIANYTTKTFAAGMANALAGFAFTNCPAQCSPNL